MAEEKLSRMMIGLSAFDLKRLKVWARTHGRAPSNFAAQIIAARIEANLELIDQLAERQAADLGISIEEFWELLSRESSDDTV
jgi:hypothetical protein